MSLLPYLHRVASREHLPPEDAHAAMLVILEGGASTAQLAAFLVALRMKGETGGELLGFARAMREKVIRVDAGGDGGPLLDTCGTGGDGASTFNVSTISAIVAAAAGARVAKHGNRSLSSQCGSADLLEAWGVDVALPPEQIGRMIREIGIGFLFAPALHPAMRHAQPARLELKMRTVFNLLGPLANPAGASRQLIGAPSAAAAAIMAEALAGLSPERAFVVHGSDGLDEVSTTGPTLVFEIERASVREHTWTPEDFGVTRARIEELRGGDTHANRVIADAILDGRLGPCRDIVLVNAAAGLIAAGCAHDFGPAMKLASNAIDSGAARAKLQSLVEFARGRPEQQMAF
jgi:anthranilate phosphoribosyltransferase